MSEDKQKNYPAATEDIAAMFKFNEPGSGSLSHGQSAPHAGADAHQASEIKSETGAAADAAFEAEIASDIQAAKTSRFGPIIKLLLPYLALFIFGVFAYYFFFSRFNLAGLFSHQQKTVQTVKNTALTQLEQQNMPAYSQWIQSYYFDVSDPAVLDPEGDNSGNGLSNFQKFLLKLNPKAYDTLGLGVSDTESLAQGVNPLTGGKLTDDQKQVLDNYIDLEVAMNRLALAHAQGRSRVAGATVWSGLRGGSQGSFFHLNNASAYGSQTGTVQNNNSSFGLPAQNGNAANNVQPLSAPGTGADTNAVAQDTLGINGLDVDTSVPGRLEIPSLNINVPLIWTTDTKNFTRDLQNGVVHYPGTALPGQIGTSYISGHSSNYLWAQGSYNQIFATLGNLPADTSFKITVVQKNGKDARLHYVVTSSKEYKPTDQEQFANTGKSVVALSTCWPVGSTAKRLVVFGELTQIEKD